MTAHELAKKLLEGPDLPVAYPKFGPMGELNFWEISSVENSEGKLFSLGQSIKENCKLISLNP